MLRLLCIIFFITTLSILPSTHASNFHLFFDKVNSSINSGTIFITMVPLYGQQETLPAIRLNLYEETRGSTIDNLYILRCEHRLSVLVVPQKTHRYQTFAWEFPCIGFKADHEPDFRTVEIIAYRQGEYGQDYITLKYSDRANNQNAITESMIVHNYDDPPDRGYPRHSRFRQQ